MTSIHKSERADQPYRDLARVPILLGSDKGPRNYNTYWGRLFVCNVNERAGPRHLHVKKEIPKKPKSWMYVDSREGDKTPSAESLFQWCAVSC
jgi:hypothetical protein